MKAEMQSLVEHWINPEIRAISAYHVANATGLVKLDAMENPYVWPKALQNEWASLLSSVDINRYPDPHAAGLKQRLRNSMGIPEEMSLLLGNGSDEIIQMIIMALAGPGRTVLSVDPGFVMYRMISTFCGMKYYGVPLKADDFSLDTQALLEAMEQHNPAVVFLAYPNNPTGNLFAEADLIKIIEAAPGLVVIDEAYAPFTDATFMGHLGNYDNLVVMRTLSKMGLAGLRLGYLVGSSVWLDEFDKVRMPYNINVLTQVSADFALKHLDVLDQQTETIRSDRQALFDELSALEGVTPYSSEANFILVKTPQGRAAEIFEGMKQLGVLIKKLDGAHPLLADSLRLTIGTSEENGACIEALAKQL